MAWERPAELPGHDLIPGSSGLTPRERLLGALAGSARADVPLILLEAPAGYGKTVLVRQWAAEDPREFTGVRLRDVGTDGAGLMTSIRRAVRRLTDREDPPRAFVLVLDGLPPLSRFAQLAIRDYARALPPGCQVVVASRDRFAAGEAESPGDRGCLRITPDQLAFTTDESRDVLAGCGLDADDVVRVMMERTQGWPAGIALAAASSDATAAARFGGDDPRVVEYFRREVLDRQPTEVRRFLLRSSVLAELTGQGCDAVLETEGSAALLRSLGARDVFIRPEATDDGRYRYHPLFGAVLRSELRLRHPDEERALHRRASTWFARQGRPRRAIEHAIAAGDLETAARLVSEHAQPLMDDGHFELARTWIEALGDDALRLHPPLGVTAAWVWAIAGDVPRALRSALTAHRGAAEGAPESGPSIVSGVAIVRAAMAPLGVEQMLRDAEFATEVEPADTLWRPTATLLLGSARLMNGDTDGAVATFVGLTRSARSSQPTAAQFCRAQLALIAAGRDDWDTAARHAAEAATLMRAGGRLDHMPSILTHAACAAVAIRGADRQRAEHEVGVASRLYRERPPVGFPWFAAQAAVAIGSILLDLGDVPGARSMAITARRHVRPLLTEGVLGDQVRMLEQRLATPELWAADAEADDEALSTAELRVLEMLPTHLPLAEIGEQLHLSRNTVKSHVTAIHRKLGCSTRADAVRRARELGLLTS